MKELVINQFKKLLDQFKKLLDQFNHKLNQFLLSKNQREIYKYEEVLAYFHSEKVKVVDFKNTALIVEKEKDNFLIQLVFLDQNMKVITGTQIKTKTIDEDLENILNGKNMVIFS